MKGEANNGNGIVMAMQIVLVNNVLVIAIVSFKP